MAIFKEHNGVVEVDVYKINFYIPKEYLELEISELQGKTLNTIGIFKFSVQHHENAVEKFYALNTPNTLSIPFEEYIETKAKIKGDTEELPYLVFSFNKGDIILKNNTIVSSAKNIEKFIKLLHSGHLPKINYTLILEQYYQVQRDNNMIFDVPMSMLAGCIAELVRSSKDISIPYRMVNNKTMKPDEFTLVSVKSLPRIVNTFSGLSFEDVNTSLVSSIAKKRLGKSDTASSPMEEILYY